MRTPGARIVMLLACLSAWGGAASASGQGNDGGKLPLWIITNVTVAVPRPPEGWDEVLQVRLFESNRSLFKNVQPDLRICLESGNVPQTCLPVCEDAEGSADGIYKCSRPTVIWFQTNLYVRVQEMDAGQGPYDPNCPSGVTCVPVAYFRVENASQCVPRCAIAIPAGKVWITFEFREITRAQYTGPFRGVLGVLPLPATVPIAKPEGVAPGMSLPTRADLERALRNLRDADNCTPGDLVFPTFNRLGFRGAEAERRYQLATLVTAIEDPATKQRVLNAARQRDTTLFDDDTFTLILADAQRARELTALRRQLGREILASLGSAGLSRVLPSLPSEIDQMILEKLTSEPLASEAVDLMFKNPSVTAECVLNELMKQGLISHVGP